MKPATCIVSCSQNAMQVTLATLIWGNTSFSLGRNNSDLLLSSDLGLFSAGGANCANRCWINWGCLALSPVHYQYLHKEKEEEKSPWYFVPLYHMSSTFCSSWIVNTLTPLMLGSFNTKQNINSCFLWFIPTLPCEYHVGYNLVEMADSSCFHLIKTFTLDA